MATRGRAYPCVGGPYDALVLCVLGDDTRVRLPTPEQVRSSQVDLPGSRKPADARAIDYRVTRLLASDGHWHEFLVASSLTSMQATTWLNRRREA